MDENQVIESVCKHLSASGFVVDQRLRTNERGIDIRADHKSKKYRLVAEAKGSTSSLPGSKRYGMPYISSQVFDRVAKGTYTCISLRESYPKKADRVVLAVPRSELFSRYLDPILPTLKRCRIEVWYVSSDGSVEIANR